MADNMESILTDLINTVTSLNKHIESLHEGQRLIIRRLLLAEQAIEALEDSYPKVIAALWSFYDHNQYGLTAHEAQLGHKLVNLALGGILPAWKPWPLCHCQLDRDATEMAKDLNARAFNPGAEWKDDVNGP